MLVALQVGYRVAGHLLHVAVHYEAFVAPNLTAPVVDVCLTVRVRFFPPLLPSF